MERRYPNGEYFRTEDDPSLTDGVRVLTRYMHPVKGQVMVSAVFVGGKIQQAFVTRNGRTEPVRRCGCPQHLLRHARENGLMLPADSAGSGGSGGGPPPPPVYRPTTPSQPGSTGTQIEPGGGSVTTERFGKTTKAVTSVTSEGTVVVCYYSRTVKINPKTKAVTYGPWELVGCYGGGSGA